MSRIVYTNGYTLLAANEAARGEGSTWATSVGFSYTEAASNATDHHVANGAGVKFYVDRLQNGYNALAFAIANDASDQFSKIQSFLNAAALDGVTAYFPKGEYNCGTGNALNLNDETNSKLVIRGDGDTTILSGRVDDGPLILKENQGGQGIFGIERMRLRNSSQDAAALVGRFNGFVGSTFFRDLHVTGTSGFSFPTEAGFEDASSDGVKVENVLFGASSALRNGTALYARAAIKAQNLVIRNFGVGLRMNGLGNYLDGFIIEVCLVGLDLGVNEDGSKDSLQAASISNGTTEANDLSMRCTSCFPSVKIESVRNYGTSNAPAGLSKTGVHIIDGKPIFLGVDTNGRYSEAAWKITNSSPTLISCQGSNHESDAAVCSWTGGFAEAYCIGNEGIPNNVPALPVLGLAQNRAAGDVAMPKNFSGVGVDVGEAATSVDVNFLPALNSVTSFLSAATAIADGSGALAEGTYWYGCIGHNDSGFAGFREDRQVSVTIASPNNAATITWAGSGDFTRRIFRGTASGVFDGYWDVPNEPNTFTDLGQAFDGWSAYPAAGEEAPGRQEPDANYAVIATPSWQTDVWVTGRSTSGFTINFGTAAPAEATVDWMLFR